jgi:hypothetical protein
MLKEKDQRMHDEDLDESYADFLKFREDLDSLGIYDSMKADNPFTEEDLLKYQEINPNFRLFRYFTNEQIV